MKMKTCPYCGKELSGEAVLCKYCHNLLIDESGNVEDNGSDDDGRTKVFKKQGAPEGDGMTKRFVMPDTKPGGNSRRSSSVIADSRANEVFPEDDYDDYDDGYDDFEEDAARKRLFTITAIITVVVLVVVIAAIVLGMQAFGKKSAGNTDDGVVEAKPSVTAPADTQAAQTQPADTQASDTQAAQTQPADSAAAIVVEGTSAPDMNASSSLDSNAAVTSPNSLPDSSSQLDPNSSQADQNLAFETSSSTDSNSSAADTNSQAATPDELESQVRTAVSSQISGAITGSQFREMDGSYAYYYFFTDDGAHGYSVAYNTADGTYVCYQNY